MNIATRKTRNASRFQQGTGCYTCQSCGKKTRSTGRGDNELVKMCAPCYDRATDENSVCDGVMTQDEFDARWGETEPKAAPATPTKTEAETLAEEICKIVGINETLAINASLGDLRTMTVDQLQQLKAMHQVVVSFRQQAAAMMGK